MSYLYKESPVEVSLDYPLYQSKKGKYFIGETPIISGSTQHALAALVNPCNSKINIFVNAITITNISPSNLSADFYLRSTFNNGVVSNLVTCVNTSIYPEPLHKGQIVYLTAATEAPTGGVSIFSRISSPYSTLVVDGGQMILGPGQCLVVYIGGFIPKTFDNIKFAMGWWEEDICPRYCY